MAITYHCKKIKAALEHPYVLSFGALHSFDSVITHIMDDDKLLGVGESTALPGYSAETQDDIFNWTTDFLTKHENKQPVELRQIIYNETSPGFRQVSLLSAIESATDYHDMFNEHEISVPVIGLIQQRAYNMLQSELDTLLTRYTTLKIKIGMDSFFDAQRVRMVQMLVPENTQIRVDANQAFTFDQAAEFLYWIDPDYIQYIEQPLPVTQWLEMAKLTKLFPQFNFMLDESIRSIQDIDHAADMNCCQYIKLNLFSLGPRGKIFLLPAFLHF